MTAVAAAVPARADVLRLKNGNVMHGEVIGETPTELQLLVNGGVVTIARHSVAEWKRESTRPAPGRGGSFADSDVSERAIGELIAKGKALEAAERLTRVAQRTVANLNRLAGRAGHAWVAVGDRAYEASQFGEAAHAYMQALSFQPAWDRGLERRFYDAALADIRTRLLEHGVLETARDRVRVLRDGLPDDPVAAWLDGRIAEGMAQPARARLAYADGVGGSTPEESLDALRARATAAAARGVPAGGDVDWSAAPLSEGATLETPEFIIAHRNGGAARRLARALTWHLRQQGAMLGRHADRFPPPGPIAVRLHTTASAMTGKAEAWAAGLAQSNFRGGSLHHESIDLLQESAQLLGSALPHELGHLMLARAIGPHARFPHALSEGFACQFEAPWKRAWYHRVVRASRGTDRMGALELLRARGYPPADRVAVFYGGSLCLIEALLARGGMDRLVRYCDRAGRADPVDALMDMYELSPAELDDVIHRRLADE